MSEPYSVELKQHLLAHPQQLTSDARQLNSDSVFVAIRGTRFDGHDCLENAHQQGVRFTLGERTPARILVPNSRLALAQLACIAWRHPSRSMQVLGVTGTSGKTTVTYLLESIFLAAGKKVGVIGTVNTRYRGKVFDATHTTPGAPELQKLLREMCDAGCDTVIMEVSSHAIDQHRVAGIAFSAVGFTNLSAEHLDYHASLEDYFGVKRRLFLAQEFHARSARASLPGDYSTRLIAEGLAKPASTEGLEVSLSGISGDCHGVAIDSSLVGSFNASNIALAVALALDSHIDSATISAGIKNLTGVPGRMQRVPDLLGLKKERHVLVDYAHKPDALEKVLQTLQEYRKQGIRVITVFGCGGDRDRLKRPLMGAIAQRYSDAVWITSDNPRSENPLAIIEEILKGIDSNRATVQIEPDRRAAIFGAIQQARAGDVVFIAGKGHECEQIILGEDGELKELPFSDFEVAREGLELKSAP